MRNVNCIFNENRTLCKNENIKKSFFGLGMRWCKIYPHGKEEECENELCFNHNKNRSNGCSEWYSGHTHECPIYKKLKMSPEGEAQRSHILVLEEVISEINNIIMDEVEIVSKTTDKGTYRLIELTRIYEKLKSIRNYFV